MTNTPDVTPPPELVQQWWEQADQYQDDPKTYFDYVATEAAQWGADQELEACRTQIIDGVGRVYITESRQRVLLAEDIWIARRPKPPSLKKQALEAMHRNWNPHNNDDFDTIRRALEQLDD